MARETHSKGNSPVAATPVVDVAPTEEPSPTHPLSLDGASRSSHARAGSSHDAVNVRPAVRMDAPSIGHGAPERIAATTSSTSGTTHPNGPRHPDVSAAAPSTPLVGGETARRLPPQSVGQVRPAQPASGTPLPESSVVAQAPSELGQRAEGRTVPNPLGGAIRSGTASTLEPTIKTAASSDHRGAVPQVDSRPTAERPAAKNGLEVPAASTPVGHARASVTPTAASVSRTPGPAGTSVASVDLHPPISTPSGALRGLHGSSEKRAADGPVDGPVREEISKSARVPERAFPGTSPSPSTAASRAIHTGRTDTALPATAQQVVAKPTVTAAPRGVRDGATPSERPSQADRMPTGQGGGANRPVRAEVVREAPTAPGLDQPALRGATRPAETVASTTRPEPMRRMPLARPSVERPVQAEAQGAEPVQGVAGAPRARTVEETVGSTGSLRADASRAPRQARDEAHRPVVVDAARTAMGTAPKGRPETGWSYSSMQVSMTAQAEPRRVDSMKDSAETNRSEAGVGNGGATPKAPVVSGTATELAHDEKPGVAGSIWSSGGAARPSADRPAVAEGVSSAPSMETGTAGIRAGRERGEAAPERAADSGGDGGSRAGTVTSTAGTVGGGAPTPRGPVPMVAVEMTKGLEALGNDLGNGTRTGVGIPAVVELPVNGTVGAESGGAMRRPGKQDKNAGNGEQKLPGTAGLSSGAAVSVGAPREAGSPRTQSGWDRVTDGGTEESMVTAVGRGRDDKARGGAGVVEDAGATVEARVNKIEELVTREVVRFRWTGQESLSVVIRPDEGTEVVMHLRQRDGQVEAMLGMTRGEAAKFGGHWQQLHDALAEQNVRLMPSRENAPALQPAAAGAGMNMGTGSGSGSGSGAGSGGQAGTGTEWRDGYASGHDERSSDRRRAPEYAATEVERSVTTTASRRRAATASGHGGRPDGWEFWA